ncbi:amino acid adenylation domain-containing protein [Tautonia sp. JC769]|uniref:amino acid adenylation domain-containing protein n=1 Tax=Tautonia sp. JC769 TaxID=3232135 RepID=UPI0034589947
MTHSPERPERAPLSFVQERLWLLGQLSIPPTTFQKTRAIRISGPLDADRLRNAWLELLRRHEVLRSRIEIAEGAPSTVVVDVDDCPSLIVHDQGGWPDACAESDRLLMEQARQPFDLEADLPIRATLIRVSDEDHLLVLSFHRIAADPPSEAIILRDLGTSYRALDDSQAVCGFTSLPRQYRDYAAWQRSPAQDEARRQSLEYWTDRLANAPGPLELPFDRPRQADPGTSTARLSWPLDGPRLDHLRALGDAEGVPIATVILAGFEILLARMAGTVDLIVGYPVDGRNHPDLGEAVGPFTDVLPLHADLSGRPTFRELVSRNHAWIHEARSHHLLPPEVLVETIRPVRSPAHDSPVTVQFAVEPRVDLGPSWSGFSLIQREIQPSPNGLELSLTLAGDGDTLLGVLEYDTELFDPETAERILGRLQIILDGAVADPDQAIDRLSILSKSEFDRVVHDWNATQLDLPIETTLHRLIEEQVQRTPTRVAVRFPDVDDDGGVIASELTFGELNQRANRLAHHLRSLGVGAEAVVAVVAERSPELVIALLGVLKAGAAYLPIDPSAPASYLKGLLEDARPRAVVTQPSFVETLMALGQPAPLVELRTPDLSPPGSDENPEPVNAPSHAAYLIYTSGSTGLPKGVINEHRAICNRLLWGQLTFPIGPGDRVLQKTPYTFDVSVWEFFWPLMTGACLVLARPDGHRDPSYIARLITRARVTHCHFVPSMLGPFLDDPVAPGCLSTLRHVFSSGEALTADLRDRFFERLGPGVELHNLYGPTEAAVEVTYHRCQPGDRPGPVPIGRPIANARTYILDEHGQPQPIGVPGELFLGGLCVARGYLNRPELTAERFLVDPFEPAGNARLYRTGDRARWLPDGSIEYLGRLDHQMKIRGVRIEPGEVEAALRRHPDVSDAAVVACEDSVAGSWLAAYIVAPAGTLPPSAAVLRRFVSEELPEAAIPSAYVPLEALPLTTSGKLNRKALPSVERGSFGAATESPPPRDPVETALADCWSEILGVDPIGLGDDFFERGGHSLAAARVMARIRLIFGVELPIRALFENPTLAALARRVAVALRESKSLGESVTTAGPIRRVEGSPTPVSPSQWRLWFLDQISPGLPVYNLSSAERLAGPLDGPALSRSLGEVVRRHETLRTVFRPDSDTNPIPVVLPDDQPSWPLPIEDLSSVPDHERMSVLTKGLHAEGERPFDLSVGPLFRARLFRVGQEDHVLQLTVHHIACDGWSLGLIWRDIAAFYHGHTSGQFASLPEIAVTFGDFAAWQAGRLAGESFRDRIASWIGQLEELPTVLELPTDRPRPSVPSMKGGHIPIEVPGAVAQGLTNLARSEGASLFMVLLGAFAALLRRYSGQTDLAIGSPGAGRPHPDLDEVVGCFVNLLVLRVNLPGNPTFRELVRAARETTLEAMAHQDIPFERIVESLNPRRDPGQHPLIQAVFTVQDYPRPALGWGTLHASTVEFELDVAKFDLTLMMTVHGGTIRGQLGYNAEIFDVKTASRLVDHFQILLRDAAAHPDRPLSECSFLTDPERRQLASWNETSTHYPRERSLVELFHERATASPDWPAIEDGGRILSYRELRRHADRLATRLRDAGVAVGDKVGLLIDRSADAVIALLAVLKTGATYVPVAPDTPARRLDYVFRDCAASAVIVRQGETDRVPRTFTGTVIELGSASHGLESVEEFDQPVDASSPAYLIYTSGSTGLPKGVLVPHRAVVRLVVGTDYAALDASDRVALASTLAFDASTFEVWGALLNGGTLVVIAREALVDPEALRNLLVSRRITTLFLTTALFHQIARSQPSTFGSLRHLLVGGEELDPAAARAVLQSSLSPCRLLNVYGPTESTTFATWHQVLPDEVAEGIHSVPIGRPIANTRAYVLDEHQRPLPVGLPGELWLGGDGLAIGYHHAPGLTARRFVPNPFGDGSEARLYRTGDRVRRLPDGTLVFLGRLDNQIKLRGFRVEPGEIEAALRRHPGVLDAAVVPQADGSGGIRLVAFVVLDGSDLPADRLRSALRDELPEFLVPSLVVSVDALPMTSSGKIDRRSLADRKLADPEPTGAPPESLTEDEQTLLRLWQEVLPNRAIGPDDDFFDLGGHSLLATRLFARIEDEFGVRPPLTHLLARSTVRRLAATLRKTIPACSPSRLVAITPVDGAQLPPFVCFPGGFGRDGMLLGHGLSLASLARLLGPDTPFFSVSLGQVPSGQTFAELIPPIAEQFLDDLKTALPEGPYYLGGYSLGGLLALEVARRLIAGGDSIGMLALIDVFGPNYPRRRSRREWIGAHLNDLRDRCAADRFRYFSEKLRSRLRPGTGLKTTPLSPEPRDEILWNSIETYLRGLEPYPGRIVLFRAATQPRKARFSHEDTTNGWGAIANGGVEVIECPGNHLTMLLPPHLAFLAAALRESFRKHSQRQATF